MNFSEGIIFLSSVAPNVPEMIEDFLRYLQFEKRASDHTVGAYEQDLRSFQAFIRNTYQIENLETVDYGIVRSWIVQLVEEGLQPSSVNRKIASLRSFFKFLLKQEVIAKDPMLKIRVLKTRKKLPSFVKEHDMAAMLDHAVFENNFEGLRDRVMLELFYATGIRLSELLNLEDIKIDSKARTIKVLGKRNKERIIPFSASLVPIIEEYRAARRKETNENNDGLFFVAKNGKRCYPMLVYRRVKKYLEAFTTADKKSPHVLRHTYATHLLNRGAEINAVKDLLGHSSLAATQVYTHNSMEKLKKVFDQAHPKA